MNVYQGLFNTTDINADNITADNAQFNNISLIGDIKTDLPTLQAVTTNLDSVLTTTPYTSLANPNTIVYRDGSGNINAQGISVDHLYVNEDIQVPKLLLYPTTDGKVFVIYDSNNNEIFYVNTSSKVGQMLGSLIVDNILYTNSLHVTTTAFVNDLFIQTLSPSQLVVSDGSNLLKSTLTLPTGCSATNMTLTNPTITLPSVINQVLRTNGSGLVYGSTSLPDFCSATSATITNSNLNNCVVQDPYITYSSSGMYNKLLVTNGSGIVGGSLTLPNNCSATNMTLTNASFVNPSINYTTANSMIRTDGSGIAYASNTLPSGLVLNTPTINGLTTFTNGLLSNVYSNIPYYSMAYSGRNTGTGGVAYRFWTNTTYDLVCDGSGNFTFPGVSNSFTSLSAGTASSTTLNVSGTSSLATLNVSGVTTASNDILPNTTNTYNLGSSSRKWKITASTASIDTLTMYGNIIPNSISYNVGTNSNLWNSVYAQNIYSSNAVNGNLAYFDAPGTGVNGYLRVTAGISGSASSSNVSKIEQIIKGSGGGNVNATIQLALYGGAYPLQLNASAGNIEVGTHLTPMADNGVYLGLGGRRWVAVYAVNGTIQTSDGNDKENIKDCELGLDFINDLKPKKYNWKGELQSDIHYGIVAQDLESALEKHNCCGFKGLHKPENENDKYGINYSQLIPVLIKSIQELSQQVTELKNEINIFKSK